MRLYLVRHGEATSEQMNPERPLTEKGRREALKVARFIQPLRLRVSAVWHSGKLRARQTAEILATAVASEKGVLERPGLAPMDPIEGVREEIVSAEEDLMVVGHMPFLGKLASALLVGNEGLEVVAFREVSLLCLEGGQEQGFTIAWMVTPQVLG